MKDAGLQGRLADFTLEEILQLIALQQKTGLLTVDASYPMILAFESGMLVGYRDARRLGTDPLESFLKRYGYFPSESWEHIDFVQRNSRLDLTEILVNEGLVDADELAALQMEAAQEDIFRGMQLRDGRYHFTPGRDGMAGLKGRVRIKVDGLLMEAVRRIDEIDGLRERFFSNDLRIRVTDPTGDTSARSAPERRLLALLARESVLSKVVAQARMSEFDTLSTLDQLREDGIVALQSQPRVAGDEVKDAVEKLRRGRSLFRPIAVSVVSVFAWGALVFLQPWSEYALPVEGDTALRFEESRERTRVEAAVQLFEQAHERLPESLDDLGPEGWLDPGTLSSARERWRLRSSATGWRLEEIADDGRDPALSPDDAR